MIKEISIGIVIILCVVGLASFITRNETANEIDLPTPTGHVTDLAGVLSVETIATLEKDLTVFNPEIAVLIVEDMGGLSIEEYGIKIADAWKVGDKDKDDGVIFILSIADRKVRIEVGYGSEEKINDAKAGRILDENVVPYFKDDNWEQGVIEGVTAIKNALK
jgi:uncharacterized protein